MANIKGIFRGLKEKKWFQAVMKVAPTFATALGGPFAGIALSTAAEALGLEEGMTEAQLAKQVEQNPEVLVKMRDVEGKWKAKMRELDITERDLELQDTQSARDMNVAMKSRTPAWLAGVVLVIFAGLAGTILWGLVSQNLVIDETVEKFMFFLFGLVGSWVGQIMTFFFGSSQGSMVKTIELAEALKAYIRTGRQNQPEV
jgi:uncharacterized membrane protein YeaQ/YmgE (transglycosylase-associated protein family)